MAEYFVITITLLWAVCSGCMALGCGYLVYVLWTAGRDWPAMAMFFPVSTLQAYSVIALLFCLAALVAMCSAINIFAKALGY